MFCEESGILKTIIASADDKIFCAVISATRPDTGLGRGVCSDSEFRTLKLEVHVQTDKFFGLSPFLQETLAPLVQEMRDPLDPTTQPDMAEPPCGTHSLFASPLHRSRHTNYSTKKKPWIFSFLLSSLQVCHTCATHVERIPEVLSTAHIRGTGPNRRRSELERKLFCSVFSRGGSFSFCVRRRVWTVLNSL